MSLIILSANPPPKYLKIALQTADGTDIPNSIEPNPTANMIAMARLAFGLTASASTQLSQASGRYNCHGLTFASRRTNVPSAGMDDGPVVADILRRDGYGKIIGQPQVGDVAVYRNEAGQIEHTGVVCRIDPPQTSGGYSVVWVWSMWGQFGEFEHKSNVSPYASVPEYWRIRS